jgi:formate/nitrite transporter FocA (FNT family)
MDQKLFPGTQFISTILDSLETKSAMSSQVWRVYLMRAAMAGMIIGIFYIAYYTIIAGFDSIPVGADSLKPIGAFLGAIVFGWALVFITYTKSELLTSNMMITSIGVYYRRITVLRSGKLLLMCYLGNFLGGLFLGLLILGSTLMSGEVGTIVGEAVDEKLAFISAGPSGWADLFVRAILCNFLINLGMLLSYNGLLKDDIAKILTMVVAVFLFAYLGLQHSVANTVLFTVYGLEYGINVGQAAANVGIALVGNMIGGGILIGYYYAYANDKSRMEQNSGNDRK